MFSSKTSFLFPNPMDASRGAWYLAVALIGQADLDAPQLDCEIVIDDLFVEAEKLASDWLQEARLRAAEFTFQVYHDANFEEADFDSMALFIGMEYRTNPRRIKVEFHPAAREQMKQLQLAIKELSQQGKLTPTSLTMRMKKVAPLTVFQMKKDPRYKAASIFTVYKHDNRILDTLPTVL